MRLSGKGNAIALVGLGIVLAILPLFLANNYQVRIAGLIGLSTILTIGLSLLMGYTGQISLGQAMFYGFGGYLTGWLAVRAGWSPWLALVTAMLFTGLFTYLIGIPILRLRGNYLAMATLGLNVIFEIFVINETELTGGPNGLVGIPKLNIGDFSLRTDVQFYYLIWFVTLAILALSLNIVNSRVGRALRSIHGSEVAAEMMGVDTERYKVEVFVLSAVYASLAGGLYGLWNGIVTPSDFGITISIGLVVMVAIGGLASVWGAIFGAAAVTILAEFLRNTLPHLLRGASGEIEIIAFGVILVVIMIFLPEGLTTGSIHRYRQWRANRAAAKRMVESVEILGAE